MALVKTMGNEGNTLCMNTEHLFPMVSWQYLVIIILGTHYTEVAYLC